MALVDSYMVTIALTALVGYLTLRLLRKYMDFKQKVAILSKIPGPETEFLFGNARQLKDTLLGESIKHDVVAKDLRRFPKLKLVWYGPAMCALQVCHPDTIKHILRGSGLNEVGLAYLRDQMVIRPKISLGWLGPVMYTVQVMHPDTVKLILRTSEPKSRNIYGLVLPWLGEGLLVSNGEKWARSRRLLTPAFHFDILKQYLLIQNQASDVLINKLSKYAREGCYFEAFTDISLFSLDVILQCACSYTSDCQNIGMTHPYIQAVTDLNDLIAERFFQFWLHNDFIYYLTPKGRKFKKACDYVHKVAEDIIKERKLKLEEQLKQDEETKCRDFLGILLTARDEAGVGMTPLEIRNEVDTFLFEGHDTTTSGTSWALYSIAKYPEVQKKIQEEIDDILDGREQEDILWEDLPRLTYTTMVLKESMRINTPVTFIQRYTTESLKLEGYEIPVGTLINVVLYNVLNNHTVWEDPMEFRPERFETANVDARDPFSFVPFSAGPRNCIGQNFAMNEMKTVVAKILRRFTLEVDPNHKVERKIAAVMKSQNGIRLKAIPREV